MKKEVFILHYGENASSHGVIAAFSTLEKAEEFIGSYKDFIHKGNMYYEDNYDAFMRIESFSVI